MVIPPRNKLLSSATSGNPVSTARDQPNILVIVMDCARSSDFQPDDKSGYLPFSHALARECIRFSRAVSPANWTLPSHASLFTGLYPWQHGVHVNGRMSLGPGPPTLAGTLAESGYATFSTSSNFLISHDLGLTRGFERSVWGGWWEPYLRLPASWWQGYNPVLTQKPQSGRMEESTASHFFQFLSVSQSISRFQTPVIDFCNRLLGKIGGYDTSVPTSAWIEPSIQNWLSKLPTKQPAFLFVNFLDAHEPYISTPERVPTFREWMRFVRLRQDKRNWAEGLWSATTGQLKLLHQMYRDSLHQIDSRIRGIVQMFKDADRWDNTLFVLTGDHGQAFGEQGYLFHTEGLSEGQVRIPLWLRNPHGEGGGQETSRWASLVDVFPTALEAAGIERRGKGMGVSLNSLAREEQDRAVLSLAEPVQFFGNALWGVPQTRGERRSQLAAYSGNLKVLTSSIPTESPKAFDVVGDQQERRDIWNEKDATMVRLADEARSALLRLEGAEKSTTSVQVVERLKAWGYT